MQYFRSKIFSEKKPAPMASEEHCIHCFDVLSSHFTHGAVPPAAFPMDQQYPLFVTWNKRGPQGGADLRGCIGCLKPLPLSSLKDYALTSALKDTRFDPIAEQELPFLTCTVSLLTNFEVAADLDDWEIGTHGVWIDFVDLQNKARNAVYLPDVIPEQGWTKKETIKSLVRKSGCNAQVTQELRDRISLTRYQSTKYTISYEDWYNLRVLPQGAARAQ